MIFKEIYLKGAFLIESEPRIDLRGSFERSFCANEFKLHNLNSIMVQSNLSKSEHKFTLRGMHFQKNEAQEAKLVRCIKGKILDVIIDIRPNSPTYCKHYSVELTEKNNLLLYVPEGFAHGFITLKDKSDVFYQVSNYYTPNAESGIRWNDPLFNIKWPCSNPVISEKDNAHPDFKP